MARVDRLAPEQCIALLSALGVGESNRPPTAFLVGLAALELLADAGGQSGAVALVDDCQWLDSATVDLQPKDLEEGWAHRVLLSRGDGRRLLPRRLTLKPRLWKLACS